jgi:hypothetical protein
MQKIMKLQKFVSLSDIGQIKHWKSNTTWRQLTIAIIDASRRANYETRI